MTKEEIEALDLDEPAEEVEIADVPREYWLPDAVYTALKWTALVALPAVGVSYQALAGVWGLPLAQEISQTCNIAALLIGMLIGVSAVAGKVGGNA